MKLWHAALSTFGCSEQPLRCGSTISQHMRKLFIPSCSSAANPPLHPAQPSPAQPSTALLSHTLSQQSSQKEYTEAHHTFCLSWQSSSSCIWISAMTRSSWMPCMTRRKIEFKGKLVNVCWGNFEIMPSLLKFWCISNYLLRRVGWEISHEVITQLEYSFFLMNLIVIWYSQYHDYYNK